MKPKSVLLVYSKLQTGGVETLIVRMSNWLVKQGQIVKVLLDSKSDLDTLLDPRVEINYLGLKYLLLNEPIINKILLQSDFFKGVDVIFSFESTTCWISTLIHKNLKIKPRFLTGVYQPNEYYSFERKIKKYFPHEIGSMIKHVVPADSILFMNEANKSTVENNLGIKFPENYLPLPIYTKSNNVREFRKPKKFKIVSVGRITYFKTYNFELLEVVKSLREQFPDILYEIYGHGQLESELTIKIQELELEDIVLFMGKLNYTHIEHVLQDAYIFIGMGTSLIEAASLGVPSIIAIFHNRKPTCYGFFQNQESYNVGEYVEDTREVDFKEIILEAINWDPERYQRECEKSVLVSQKFNIDKVLHNFLAYSNNNKLTNLNYFSILKYEKYFLKYIFLKFIKGTIKRILKGIN